MIGDRIRIELWESLAHFWKIGELCIPAKHDKFGRRFAFARFVEVRDATTLLRKIEDLWFGTYKLRANISKFSKEEVGSGATGKQIGRVQQHNGNVNGGIPLANKGVQKGVSFKEALGGGGKKGTVTTGSRKKTQELGYNNDDEDLVGVLEIESVPENVDKLKHSYVGTLCDAKLAANAQMMISMEGFKDIKATLLGMDKILLSSNIKDGVERAYEADKQWWECKFSDLKPWSPIQKPIGRLIWVRIFGAPRHAWGWECFNRIVWSYGKLIQLDSQTEKQDRLDVARALIAVSSWNFVDEVMSIKVCNEHFVVRIVEERFGDFNLGVKREADSQIYSDGSLAENSQSDQDDIIDHGRPCDDGIGGGWVEGWPENSSSGQLQNGYCLEDTISVVSDTPEKGVGERVLDVQLKGIDESGVGRSEEQNFKLGEKDGNKRKDEACLALTRVGIEVGDEIHHMREDCVSSAHNRGERREMLVLSREVGEKEVRVCDPHPIDNGSGPPILDHALGLGCGINNNKNNKGKCIMEEGVDVAMKNRSLFLGGCSSKNIGLHGPREVLDVEYQGVRILKDKEVAQLEMLYENTLSERRELEGGQTKSMKSKKHNGGGGAVQGVNSMYTGESRQQNDEACRFYRIEAGRFFNIGMNLGVTTNAEKITMVERLMDLEAKDMRVVDEWEDDEVNQ
ncbi:hypothetical protein TSUD_139970 [Trifolium subterraneum]|uniref:Uncharacterized protein n=1 Tax=Trifolium subterraneum TaxID=3900 RepID=A0A2Z6PFG7_TRISU|nr:hypothetical protein TSUD_139970 [Trifolium subterraneum]